MAKATGIEAMFIRHENGIERFLTAVQEQFGKTRDEAKAVYDTFRRHKLVRIDKITGQFRVTVGLAWEQGVIDRAVTWTDHPGSK
jgi:hypothetical protein